MNQSSAFPKEAFEASFSSSFLLRIWPAGPSGESGWRASLQDLQTGNRVGFAHLEELFGYLLERSEKIEELGGVP